MKLGEFRRLTVCLTDEAEIVVETRDEHGAPTFFDPTRLRLSSPLGAVVVETFKITEPHFK